MRTSFEQSEALIAIVVLIEPDAAAVEKAKATNARLRQNYPQGFALDAAHVAHVTMVQRFARARDLDTVAAAVEKVAQSGRPFPMKLTATSYVSVERDGVGVLVLAVERAPELLQLVSDIVNAVQPFAANGGSANAFARAPGEEINENTIKYVEGFVPVSSGEKYFPHVTVGTAQLNFVKALEAEPFAKLSFSGVNIAIYQLGNFGTAQKRLWTWKEQ